MLLPREASRASWTARVRSDVRRLPSTQDASGTGARLNPFWGRAVPAGRYCSHRRHSDLAPLRCHEHGESVFRRSPYLLSGLDWTVKYLLNRPDQLCRAERHTLAINGSFAFPLGVQMSGILTYRSALPYSAITSAPRPDGKPFSFRPEPRNARRGDGALSLDLRLAKTMKVGARLAASAFLEVFNVTNQLNYGDYIGTVTSALFGQPTTAGPKRRLQLGLRVDF
jgi:hypothetical protein